MPEFNKEPAALNLESANLLMTEVPGNTLCVTLDPPIRLVDRIGAAGVMELVRGALDIRNKYLT